MKHTYTHIQRIASVAAAFALTFSMGAAAGDVMVTNAYREGTGLTALLVRPSVAPVRAASSRSSRPRRQKVLRRAAIVKPSTRRAMSGSVVSRAAVSSAARLPIKAGCGDGLLIKDMAEECDDGNKLAGDGCNASCKLESGFQCYGQPSRCVSRCGDGIVTQAEKCDDGNVHGGDGCSGLCKIEFRFICSGSPSVCEPTPYCGDGVKASTEQCDDGNADYGDGCTPLCKTE